MGLVECKDMSMHVSDVVQHAGNQHALRQRVNSVVMLPPQIDAAMGLFVLLRTVLLWCRQFAIFNKLQRTSTCSFHRIWSCHDDLLLAILFSGSRVVINDHGGGHQLVMVTARSRRCISAVAWIKGPCLQITRKMLPNPTSPLLPLQEACDTKYMDHQIPWWL